MTKTAGLNLYLLCPTLRAMASSLRCLVLNASMEPISVVSAQRGLVLLLKERAMMLERAQVVPVVSAHGSIRASQDLSLYLWFTDKQERRRPCTNARIRPFAKISTVSS
jgi:hypothetical protein